MPTYPCSICGKVHDALPALGFSAPDYYRMLSDEETSDIAELSDDFCIIRHPEQTDRFIRTTLTISVHNACDDLDYGVWVSLSEKSFEEYKAEFHHNQEKKTYFGRISNWIPGYEASTLGLHVDVVTRTGGYRPELIPHQSEHVLIKDWEHGISLEEAEKRIAQVIGNHPE